MNGSGRGGHRGRLVQSVLWRRLDHPGLESFRLWQDDEGVRLDGTVLLALEGAPYEVTYEVLCGPGWETRVARVEQVSGASRKSVDIRRDDAGRWSLNGTRVPELDGIADVDLGFTPSTNTLPIRRLSLEIGSTAELDAAWLRFPELTLEVLPQRYSRLDAERYRYESAGGSFTAELDVDEHGIVVRYGQWFEVVGRGVP